MQGLEAFYPARKEDLPAIIKEVLFFDDFVADSRFTENMETIGFYDMVPAPKKESKKGKKKKKEGKNSL